MPSTFRVSTVLGAPKARLVLRFVVSELLSTMKCREAFAWCGLHKWLVQGVVECWTLTLPCVRCFRVNVMLKVVVLVLTNLLFLQVVVTVTCPVRAVWTIGVVSWLLNDISVV